jgi:hypothetical protein
VKPLPNSDNFKVGEGGGGLSPNAVHFGRPAA